MKSWARDCSASGGEATGAIVRCTDLATDRNVTSAPPFRVPRILVLVIASTAFGLLATFTRGAIDPGMGGDPHPTPPALRASVVPTFQCMSLYWPREDGAFTNRCDVRYRAAGMAEWRQAQDLWWDAVHKFYAGAVVGLKSGTTYEFSLRLDGGASTQLSARTWADVFPVARVVTLPAGTITQTLVITNCGTPAGYVVYEAAPGGTTFDMDPGGGDESDALDHCVVIDADYVILRGLTLRNAKTHGVLIKNRHDLVIEGCDISNWGSRDPRAGQRGTVHRYAGGGSLEVTFAPNLARQMDSAIKGEGAATHDIERVVIQGNRIHHPRYCANSWNEGSAFFNSFHPQGAKAVCLFRPGEELPTKGNHVIRYNDFYSDPEHLFYDILFDSQGSGPMQGTDAQRDMDIYGNIFRDCLDDCMELERGFGNVRVFENYFDNIFKAMTGFTSQSGPYYMFRNVFDRVLQPSRDHAPDTRAWTGCAFQSGERRFYFYHNTMLCPGGEDGAGFCWAYGNDYKRIGEGRGAVDDGNFTISRNNIYQTIRWPDDVNYVTRRLHGGFSFDYELYNGVLETNVAEAVAIWGRHAIQGTPVYRAGHGSGQVGRAQLDARSAGKDAGCRLPNFNDDFEGAAPDMGAHEHATPDMKLGVKAYQELYQRSAAAWGVERRVDSVRINWQGRAVGEYVFRDAKIPRPYFTRLYAPDGTQLTRNHPPVKGVDATDHDTLHPGLWLAFGDLNGVDFWRNKGRIEHVRFVSEPRVKGGRLSFAVEERYLAGDGSEVSRGVNEFVFVAGDTLAPALPGTLLLWSTTLRRADGPLTFGPQHEMGLGFRMATPLVVKGGAGHILGSHGGKDEAGSWGRIGTWWHYSGTVNDRHAGILAVAAPDNTRPVWSHARDYGFLALNPTGPPADGKDVPSVPFTLPAGESLRLRFGLLLQAGSTALDAPAAAAIINAELTSASQPDRALDEYRAELQQCRDAHGGSYDVPDVEFFLFGMGARAKLFYRGGALFDARDGRELRRWPVKREVIVPPDYAVHLETEDGKAVVLREDAEAVWLEEGAQRTALANTKLPVKLPDFAGKKYPRVLRVLHQELLVNIVEAGPVPNLFVYAKPWYRDGAMVALALKETGNLELMKQWILRLRDPFDRNNKGETEADNLGQALFLISLVADKNHPLVAKVLAEVSRFERSDATGTFISGRSDFADHPVYQTKWLKFGLKALGLPDSYVIPMVADSYGALFWMDYRDQHVAGKDSDDRGRYPYLGWACDHFHGTRKSPLSNRDYPLTWEAHASEARYDGLKRLAPVFAEKRISLPHTWHAAEAFLLLITE